MAETEFRIDSDSPVDNELLFWCIAGYECLGRPSAYELRVLSPNGAIDPKQILGHAFDVVIGFEDEEGSKHERHAQGHAVRFSRAQPVGRFFQYHISLRSWFWLLSKRINSRIFQEQDIFQVFDTVVDSTPLKAVKKTTRDGVMGSHPARRYCVQHQEQDEQFLQRLLEDEGVYYWFDVHKAPGTMHLADASVTAHSKLPAQSTLCLRPADREIRFNELGWTSRVDKVRSGGYVARDSDFKAIRKQLSGDKSDPDSHELADFEVFEFPGGFFSGDDSQERAKLRMEELAAKREMFVAGTFWPDVTVGKTFDYDSGGRPDDAMANGSYLIGNCAFGARQPGYEGLHLSRQDAEQLANAMSSPLLAYALHDALWTGEYASDLQVYMHSAITGGIEDANNPLFFMTLLHADRPYRPQRLVPRVPMPGPQSAIVVGPEGKEIYADDFGRVKVQFHWDRYGESDENSTCWVRVSQPWAGKGWGGYFIPRIGQEVLVDFINGDPDRPVIVGRLYNSDQPIPFDKHEQSGFRTRSTPNGSTSNCNEFRFDDEKGKEQVYLHAERNQDIEVEADETHWVGHDRRKTIDNDETSHIKNNRTETVDVDESITIGGDRTETIGGDEAITIAGNRTEAVGGNESITIGGNRTETVNANESLSVGANRIDNVGASLVQNVGAAAIQNVGGAYTQTVAGPYLVNCAGPVTFSAAGGFTIIAPGGTKIIDMELYQIGGTIKEGYASKLDFNGAAIEVNLLKGELTGSTNSVVGLKFEKVGADISTKELRTEAITNAKMAAIGLYMLHCVGEIHL